MPLDTQPHTEIFLRITKFQGIMKDRNIDAALILQPTDRFYFTGTLQDGLLFIPVKGDPLFMVRKHPDRAREESPVKNIVPSVKPELIPDILKKEGYDAPKRLGFEMDVLPANLYVKFKSVFKESEITDVSHEIRLTRSVKSAYEIEMTEKAAEMGDSLFKAAEEIIKEGATEVETAGLLEAKARALGHQGVVRMRLWGSELFYGHFMSGPAAAVPSYLSSPTGGKGVGPSIGQGAGYNIIRKNEPILFDYVFPVNGYVADQARIFSFGPIDAELEKGHEIMLGVQELVMKEAKPGVLAGDLYEMAVDYVNSRNFGEFFMGADENRIRFIGHGLGLELDEYPFLAKNQAMPLEENMIIALEPKLIFPGKGVVGIENTHIVTKNGLRKLNQYPESIKKLN